MKESAWGDSSTQFFFELTPERVLDAVEASRLRCNGLCTALNSMENRVYEVELEEDDESIEEDTLFFSQPIHQRRRIVKFYRPGRWSKEQILEEHGFLLDLLANEIPVVAPLKFPNGETLVQMEEVGIWYSIFPKRGGRAPDELDTNQLQQIGRLLARIHTTGRSKESLHRIHLNERTYGKDHLDTLISMDQIPESWKERFQNAVQGIVSQAEPLFSKVSKQRVHGDCHLGNLLWSDRGAMFLDFDDMVVGPCVQDLWLLIPGRDEWAKERFKVLLASYEEMLDFDRTSLRLIEPLRALRMIHFAVWMAKRWDDPAFPRAFPHFGTERYWSQLTLDLEEQFRLIQDTHEAQW